MTTAGRNFLERTLIVAASVLACLPAKPLPLFEEAQREDTNHRLRGMILKGVLGKQTFVMFKVDIIPIKRIVLLAGFIFAVFLLEFLLFNVFSHKFQPNLLLLIIIFFNVRLGLSYSLFVALLAGILKDSFSTGAFGTYIFTFVTCSYATSLLKSFLYQKGYGFSRVLMALGMSMLSVLLVYWIHSIYGYVDFPQSIHHIFFPEVLATTFVSLFAFRRLKQCVLRLSA